MVIPVIGPSKAGKTAATTTFVTLETPETLFESLVRVDLDEVLGSSHRGNGQMACEEIRRLVAMTPRRHVVLMDVGAGQLVSRRVAEYIRKLDDYPRSVVVVWCDEDTFRDRHGPNAPNEVPRYYGPYDLAGFWERAASAGRLVDTSGGYRPAE